METCKSRFGGEGLVLLSNQDLASYPTFCTQEQPDKFRATCFVTSLSERWHRVAIQQAAGIAKSWRTNRAQA